MHLSAPQIAEFHRRLHRWYKAHGRRDLPWRNTRDPYPIYLSEIMLQQTQVKTVLERYYAPFLKRFPSLRSIAGAPLQAVLKQWEGLGYYRRAAHLHATAMQCGGILPGTVDGLLALPGIGKNTAHAIAAFAHHAPVPVLEANVKRVVARIFALRAPSEAQLWQRAAQLLDTHRPFDYNQAMMDIGALVCTRAKPRCAECPAQSLCAGKNNPLAYPAQAKKTSVPVRKKTIVAFKNAEDAFYIAPRQTRFLHGLFGFPEFEGSQASVRFQGRKYALSPATLLGTVTQSYSHFTLQADVHLCHARHSGKAWKKPAGIATLPLSRADAKVLSLLKSTLRRR